MEDLMTTFGQWFGAMSHYDVTDWNGFVTAILRSVGYTGEDWAGFSTMASVSDWFFGLFGPLTTLYEFLISSIDSETFVKVVSWLLNGFGK